MNTWWEPSEDERFVAYLCYQTSLPVVTTYKPKEWEPLTLFDFAGIFVDSTEEPAEYLKEVGRESHTMRLPYTREMLIRREERLAS